MPTCSNRDRLALQPLFLALLLPLAIGGCKDNSSAVLSRTKPPSPPRPEAPSKAQNALIDAAYHGRLYDVKRLLGERDADINGAGIADTGSGPHRLRAIQAAALSGNVELVTYLLEKGADPLAKDQFGDDAYMYAAWGCNFDILKRLDRTGKKFSKVYHDGMTPLLAGGGCNLRVERLSYLIDRGYDIDAIARDGRSALTLAAKTGKGRPSKFS